MLDNKPLVSKDPSKMPRDCLEKKHFQAYAVGHFFNDLCAAAWFTYLLYYIKQVVKLDPVNTGLTMLSGQITDGITTPIVGYFSDKTETRIGRRTPWYIFGTILVAPTYFGIFSGCIACYAVGDIEPSTWSNHHSVEIAYYITLPALFNVGWASVQIANMAIVNQMSASQQRRDRLISLRNGFTFVANFTVLVVASILIGTIDDPFWQFRALCWFIILLGLCSSMYYMATIKELTIEKKSKTYDDAYRQANKENEKAVGEAAAVLNAVGAGGAGSLFGKSSAHQSLIALQKREEHNAMSGSMQHLGRTPEDPFISDNDVEQLAKEELAKGMRPQDWVKEGTFYVHGMVYMFTRIAVNVTMSVQPFYLIHVTKFSKGSGSNPTPLPIALVPLVSYITSTIFSLMFYKPMLRKFRNRYIPFIIAVAIIFVGSFPLAFLNGETAVNWLVYPLSAVQGVGLAIMLNTATSLISDVIGNDDTSAAFVYGAYSFFDKLANGLLIFVITTYWIEEETPLRYIIAVTPIVSALASFGFTYLGKTLYSSKLAKISIDIRKKASKRLNSGQVGTAGKGLSIQAKAMSQITEDDADVRATELSKSK